MNMYIFQSVETDEIIIVKELDPKDAADLIDEEVKLLKTVDQTTSIIYRSFEV